MRSKKIITGLLMLGVIASSCALFNQFNAKEAFAENIKQDVVYTKNDASAVSKDDFALDKDVDEAIKQKVLDAYQKYFNESPETFKDWNYNSSILNENTIDGLREKELNSIQESYAKNEISYEEYIKEKNDANKNDDGLKDNISNKLKHGVIQTALSEENGDGCRLAFLNENTKEIEWILGPSNTDESATPLTTSDEQLENIAEDFIKQNKLGDIENPKFIMFSGKGHHGLFYQDENDPTKKAKITIDPSTNKVSSFAIKSYADMFYNEIIAENN